MLFYVRDRTSAIKQPVQVNLNASISANSTGNKEAPLVERKLNTAVCSAKARNDAIIHDMPVSVMDNPRQHLFKNQEPPAQYNDHATTKGPCSQVNDDASLNGLHKTVLPMNKTESLLISVKSQLPFDAKVTEKGFSTLFFSVRTNYKMFDFLCILSFNFRKKMSIRAL